MIPSGEVVVPVARLRRRRPFHVRIGRLRVKVAAACRDEVGGDLRGQTGAEDGNGKETKAQGPRACCSSWWGRNYSPPAERSNATALPLGAARFSRDLTRQIVEATTSSAHPST